ncbi:MAG TPA: methyltransferase domain-containing protein [Actinomycetota bacterium]|nr:methyltransferase domain-containing protein [Actinomycetota bacterium]
MDQKDASRWLLEYGPVFMGAGVWALARYPEELKWASNLYAQAFAPLAGVYDEWTRLPGYDEALMGSLDEIRTPPSRIIDVACGTGFAAMLIKRQFPEAQVTGIDISQEMVDVASHNATREGLDIDFAVGDSSALDFEAGTFDLAVVNNSLIYPQELLRLVSKRGRVVVAWSFGGPWVAMAWKTLAPKFEAAGADHVWGERRGPGFYAVARKA